MSRFKHFPSMTNSYSFVPVLSGIFPSFHFSLYHFLIPYDLGANHNYSTQFSVHSSNTISYVK